MSFLRTWWFQFRHAMMFALLLAVALGACAAASNEPRIALVIGNGAYQEGPLRNPVNDARKMAAMLRELGFVVVSHENATKRTMETAILDFGQRLTRGGVGLFYYAGHGLQVRGHNYLVPVDAQIGVEAAARIAGLDVDLVLEQMAEARNRVNIVILDACRDNPFERRLRGASRGLAAIDAARGTLIAYATAPGSGAADGDGDGANGLYTDELLKALRVPGLSIEEVFKRVRTNVTQRSNGAQTPWESSSLTGDLVVNLTVNVDASPTMAATADREALFWSSVKDSQDAALFQAYLNRYPDGTFTELARRKLSTATTGAKASVFDGVWAVTVDCPRMPSGAEGYTLNLFATVRDGLLHGQYGTPGQPSSLTLEGTIQADGTAGINASGITGDPKYAIHGEAKGSPYKYRAAAHFDGARGTGKRLDVRQCQLSFSKP